jgi:hypothetical protein
MESFVKVFTIATGAALAGLVLYNSKDVADIMKAAGGALGQYVGDVRGKHA